MKKNLLVLAGTLFITYVGFICIFTNGPLKNKLSNVKNYTGDWGHSAKRFQEAENTKNVDILFIGSSHTYRGFDPRVFNKNGIKILNLGSSSQSPYNSYFILKIYLEKIKTQYVVLDVYPKIFCIDAVEPSIDLISNMPISSSTIEMGLKTKNILVFNSLVATCFNRLLKPLNEYAQQEFPFNKYVKGGFVENTYEPLHLTTIQTWPFENDKFNEIQFTYFNKIIELTKKKNVKLLVVTTPAIPTLVYKTVNYKEFIQRITNSTLKYKIPFFNYSDPEQFKKMNLNPLVDFYDPHHMRQTGVEKFNQFFINEFARLRREIPKV